jgi:IS30 family transposase
MEKRYKQLSLEKRDVITEMKAINSLQEIARTLGRSPSTISMDATGMREG